ncbi:MAG: hypothetical protein IT410_00445 [Candidatus Doudnabacteria bacterium]|nr:hypothetical protein [Candidatus Doudnabacteria bacterium]
MRFILAPLLFALGVLMMKYTVKVTEFMGTVGFAEKYMRSGFAGTYTWYRLVGLLFCILAVLWIFGVLNFSFLEAVVSGPGSQN